MANSTIKGWSVEGNSLIFPTSLIGGLDAFVDGKISTFKTDTVDKEIADLSSVFLGINAKAQSAAAADTATNAGKATNDDLGRKISTTYYTTATTVAKATADANGKTISSTYLTTTGKAANSAKADSCTTALKATQDSNGSVIRTTYLTSVTGNGSVVTVKKGDGTQSTFTVPNTTYEVATRTNAGLLSAADKIKIDDKIGIKFSRIHISYNFNVDDATECGIYYFNTHLSSYTIYNIPNTSQGGPVTMVVFPANTYGMFQIYAMHAFGRLFWRCVIPDQNNFWDADGNRREMAKWREINCATVECKNPYNPAAAGT